MVGRLDRQRHRNGLKLLVVALAMLIALFAVAGCGGDGGETIADEPVPEEADTAADEADTSAAPTTADAESEQRDELAIALQELGTTLDTVTYQAATMTIFQATQEPLVYYEEREVEGSDTPVFDPTAFTGGVVESWEVAEDGSSVTMVLREGVQSPYGNTLTAEDVKWTVDRNVALESLGAAFAFSQAGIDPENPITVVDERTFQFNLAFASPNLLKVLNWHWESPIDSVEARSHATEEDPWATEWLTTHTASFGPYNVEEFTAGQSATLVANPNYWQGEVPIKRIVMRVVPDPGNRQQLLESGDVQYVPDLPRVQLAELAENDAVKVEYARSTRMLYLVTNNGSEPFDDPLVRQATAWALPYEQINEQAYQGTATIASGPVSPLLEFHAGDTWPYATDPERARELLAEAGYPDGFDATLQYSLSNPGPENAQVAVQVQAALRDIGINIQLQQATSDAVLFADLLEKKVPFGLGGTAPFVPDAGYQLINTGTIAAPSAFAAFDNARFEELVTASIQTADPAEREELLTEAQQIWADEVAMVPILEPNNGLAMDPALTGFVMQPTGFPLLGKFRFEG